jgi:hypothetical protein
MPSFCLHDKEKETFELAKLVGILRSDERFRCAYDSRLDELLAEKRIWLRTEDGFLAAPPDQLSAPAWTYAYVAIQKHWEQEGFIDRAVSVLKCAGYNAWKDSVGHIGVDPKSIAAL